MLEARENPRLLLQPRDVRGVDLRSGEHLDRNGAIELAIAAAIDGAHAAATERLDHLVAIAGDERPVRHVAQVIDGRVGQPRHRSPPRSSSRASASNSLPSPQIARSRSSSSRRNALRAADR